MAWGKYLQKWLFSDFPIANSIGLVNFESFLTICFVWRLSWQSIKPNGQNKFGASEHLQTQEMDRETRHPNKNIWEGEDEDVDGRGLSSGQGGHWLAASS